MTRTGAWIAETESALRIALLTFALLALIGVTIGHAARDKAPRVLDQAGTIRIKL